MALINHSIGDTPSGNERFLAKCTILSPDRQTAEIYGKTKAALMEKGKPIPENDIWIDAIALQHDLSLYKNDKHFREVGWPSNFQPTFFYLIQQKIFINCNPHRL